MNLGYTIFHVPNVVNSMKFFTDVFGVKPRFLHESEDYGELETGETVLTFSSYRLGDYNLPNGCIRAADNSHPLGVVTALVVDEVSDLHEKALQHGALEVKAVEHKPWGQTTSIVRSPDGILIQLCSRSFDLINPGAGYQGLTVSKDPLGAQNKLYARQRMGRLVTKVACVLVALLVASVVMGSLRKSAALKNALNIKSLPDTAEVVESGGKTWKNDFFEADVEASPEEIYKLMAGRPFVKSTWVPESVEANWISGIEPMDVGSHWQWASGRNAEAATTCSVYVNKEHTRAFIRYQKEEL